jgi:hypothetical protein
MRTDRARPFLSLYAFGRERMDVEPISFAIRDAHGRVTPEYRDIRAELGLSTPL